MLIFRYFQLYICIFFQWAWYYIKLKQGTSIAFEIHKKSPETEKKTTQLNKNPKTIQKKLASHCIRNWLEKNQYIRKHKKLAVHLSSSSFKSFWTLTLEHSPFANNHSIALEDVGPSWSILDPLNNFLLPLPWVSVMDFIPGSEDTRGSLKTMPLINLPRRTFSIANHSHLSSVEF